MGKIHFAEMENYGSYEYPCYGAETTLCGYDGEIPLATAVNVWEQVTCKRCLRLRAQYEINMAEDEKIIVQQMGEMRILWKRKVCYGD